MIIEIAGLCIEGDAVAGELWRFVLFHINQPFAVDCNCGPRFDFGRFVIGEKPTRFAACQIDNNDRADA